VFVVVGLIGIVLLLLTIFFDDFLDAVIPDLGWLSGPVIGAFLAAFGLFGWAIDSNADAGAWLAVLVGIGGGVVLGYFTYRLGRVLWAIPTDATPTTANTVGTEGRVVTPIMAGRTGEIVVRLGGQPVKFTATADVDVPNGARVVVVAVESNSKLRVETAEQFWGGADTSA
jgi:hypothetical protein